MAKKKKKHDEETTAEQKELIIIGGTIKDEFCSYEFEVKTGVGIGDIHKVKGSGIIDPDLTKAFAKLNVHLAVIDDVFKHSDIEIDNVDKFHNHELVSDFDVTGFKIKGNDEMEAIILIGTKRVSSSGERMTIETPRIPMDELSSYRWKNELKEAADNVRTEVELYKNGKCTVREIEEQEDPEQLKITDVNFEGAEHQ